MPTPSETALSLAERIGSLFSVLAADNIGSDDYRDNIVAIEECLKELSKIHPNWSEDEGRIISPQRDDTPFVADRGADRYVFVYQHLRWLVAAWDEMKASQPTINSISTGSNAFRIALGNLREECIFVNP